MPSDCNRRSCSLTCEIRSHGMIVPAPRMSMVALSRGTPEVSRCESSALPGWSADQKTALSSALLPLIRPNVVLDQTATAAARETEANRVAAGRDLVETQSSGRARRRHGHAQHSRADHRDQELRHRRPTLAQLFRIVAGGDRGLLGRVEVCGTPKRRQCAQSRASRKRSHSSAPRSSSRQR